MERGVNSRICGGLCGPGDGGNGIGGLYAAS